MPPCARRPDEPVPGNDLNQLYRSGRLVSLLIAILTTLIAAPGFADDLAQHGALILVYHRFGPTAGATTVSDKTLDEQLEWPATHGSVAPLRSVVEALRTGMPARDRPCVAITADDGHRSVYTDLYPRLLHYRLPVTLFIYPPAISNASYALTWHELAEMVKSGLVDVQSHTYWHPNFHQEKAHRSPADYQAFVDTQLAHSKSVLETRIGLKVDMLAWPYGIYDEQLGTSALRAGYTAGFVLGNTVASPGANMLALPRFWMTDSVHAAQLKTMLAKTCPVPGKE